MAALGLHYCVLAFSSCSEWGLLTCCPAWALGLEGLVALWHMGSFWARAQIGGPCFGR